MFSVSDEYKIRCKELGRQKDTLITYTDTEGVEYIFSPHEVEYKSTGKIFKTCMAFFTAEFRDDKQGVLHEKVVTLKNGIKLDNGEFEYANYGDFFVKDIEQNIEKNTTKYTCYDKMINFMKQYQKVDVAYPCTLLEFLKAVCFACSVELYDENIFNADLEISIDYYNELNFTYRDVLDQIAQVTGSTIFIKDNKLYFSGINNTDETLGVDVLSKIKIGEHFKPLNSLVLSREPQEDNIYSRDEEMVARDGLFEIRFNNNEIIDKRRNQVVDELFNHIKGIEYYTFNAEEIGLGYFEPCDKVSLFDLLGNKYDVVILNIITKLTSGMKESISADITGSTTQYQYASTSEKRLKNTEIIVDKQKGEIKSIAQDTEDNFTQVNQRIDNINYNVQAVGGLNLIRNSAMFLLDNNKPAYWDVAGSGLKIQSSPDSINAGGISGNEFILTNTSAKQTVTNIKIDDADILEDKKAYYSLGVRIKKELGSTVKIKIYSSSIEDEKYELNIPEDKECHYEIYSIKAILPKVETYIIEFWSDNGAIFTDAMFSIGKDTRAWTQANGEYMNTNVTIDKEGIRVKSNIYQGDYTVVSPLEFAGYSSASGQLEKTFYLQRDETHSKKMKVTDSITIADTTMLPIDTGGAKGIVFI